MRSLFLQISVLIGLLTLSNRLSGDGPMTEAGLAAMGSATAMYVVLVVGDVLVQRALEYLSPATPKHEESAEPVADTESVDPSAESRTALAA